MKVKELIEKLNTFDPEMDVWTYDMAYGYEPDLDAYVDGRGRLVIR